MATYSTLDDADRAWLARAYGLEITELVPVAAGMANSSFVAVTSRGRLVISVLDNHDEASARRLAVVGEHVRRQGIPTNEVVASRDGDIVTFVRNTPVLVRRWLAGRTYDDLPVRHLGAAGGLLAALHRCDVADLDVPVGNRRLHAALRAVLDDFPNQAHADWIRHRLARLDQSFPDPDTARRPQWRIVHGDFHGPNIVVAASGRLALIDWETATVDDPMLDVGMAVVGLCGSGGRLDQSRVRRFLAGYAASGGVVEPRLLGPAVEYAGVILAFHRYRRHHMRFPDPTRHGYFQEMVTFVEREFPADGAGKVSRVGQR